MITDVYGHCRMTGCYSLRVDWTSRLLVKHHSIWLVSHSTMEPTYSLTTQDFNYTLISHLLQNKSFIVFFCFVLFQFQWSVLFCLLSLFLFPPPPLEEKEKRLHASPPMSSSSIAALPPTPPTPLAKPGHGTSRRIMGWVQSPHTLAFINGLEIVSIPNRLYIKGGFDCQVTVFGIVLALKAMDS